MLVLSRKPTEKLIITVPGHKDIVLSIQDVRGQRVRIGVDAEPEIKVWREEIYEGASRES